MRTPHAASIGGFIFDWGGVIIDEPSRQLQEYCATFLQCNVEQGCNAIEQILPQYQQNQISEQTMWQQVCQMANGNQEQLIQTQQFSLWSQAVRSVFTFRHGVLEAIYLLRQKGYALGFLSNTEPAAAQFFHERKMEELFDYCVLSCEVGMSKPNLAIYELVLAGMNAHRCHQPNTLPLHPSQVVMLDDRIENIQGALQVGMQAYHVQNATQFEQYLQSFL
jgi:putative hydrolase of the HAD superfamily